MLFAFLENNVVVRVMPVDWEKQEIYGVVCEGIDVHALDTYMDGHFYRDGQKLVTAEESAQQTLTLMREVAQRLPDEVAVEVPELFPEWNEAGVYAADIKMRFDGKLYRCLQAHRAQADWTPTSAASLWAVILPGQSGSEIGEWVQPDSTNPYKKGDKVMHSGKTWESAIDNNVWEPGVYGWTEV